MSAHPPGLPQSCWSLKLNLNSTHTPITSIANSLRMLWEWLHTLQGANYIAAWWLQCTMSCNCNTLIGVHEMHGLMHPNNLGQTLATILLAHDSLSLSAYPTITHMPLVYSRYHIGIKYQSTPLSEPEVWCTIDGPFLQDYGSFARAFWFPNGKQVLHNTVYGEI